MQKLVTITLVVGFLYFLLNEPNPIEPVSSERIDKQIVATSDPIADAFENRRTNFQVESSGVVTRVLADDNEGDRHQRFILRLASGQTLLVAHNIDLAPRISALNEGDTVDFFGEYEWNDQGGVMHWTHRDPRERHVAGWLRHKGRVYQ